MQKLTSRKLAFNSPEVELYLDKSTIWSDMFHSRIVDNEIDGIHEKALRSTQKTNPSSLRKNDDHTPVETSQRNL